ncbi:PIN domain-containing protein [Streptococcus cuniculi]|uniref:DUF4935 domain-containing protein n=1 Tax=Streptococcus cuniculi TaxID=1432788 RepID=A0A4Y9J8W3_9STRE|nr:PIN domain-containing protein [Streptococcus cuniculi]MBF0778697.1 DUF4935 domain-containing protein [Streptococcus cuniculi]TFU97332.1 hypothetical protein E4T82_08185 [Streptococcus cuniculi]
MKNIISDKILVFFDTNIFRNTGFNFQNEFYVRLMELKIKFPNLTILVVPVLYHEILNQLRKATEIQIKEVEAVMESLERNKFGTYSDKLDISQFNADDFIDSKITELKDFLLHFTEAKYFDLDNEEFSYNTSEVLQDFFDGNAPFSGNKKYEFKDAFLIQNIKQIVSGEAENSESQVIIVSADVGFREGVMSKIDREIIIYDDYKKFFDLLSQREEKYQSFYSFVSENDFSHIVNDKLSKFKCSFVEKYILEKEDIVVDGRDLDKKGYHHGYDYNEICINTFKIIDKEPKINIIRIDGMRANLSISYKYRISLTGIVDNGYYNESQTVDEEHITTVLLNMKVEENHENFDIIESNVEKIVLYKKTLRKRSEPRYVYSGEYVPSLQPDLSEFTILCENCKKESNFDSPTSRDFEVTASWEGNMGDLVQHTYYFNENCSYCGNDFEGEFIVTEYPYLMIDNCEASCKGGEVSTLDYSYY